MSKPRRNGRMSLGSLNRRETLHVGGLTALGITLPHLLRSEGLASQPQPARSETAPAKACILFFMEGGPSHIDMWDMKPKAPEQIRGIYKPIATSLPGMSVCEHLPLLASQMHHMTVVRSVSHSIVDHNAGSHYILTGKYPMRESQLIRGPSPENAPPYGSVLAKLRPISQPLPDYVHLPKEFFNCGHFIPGVLAGFLGDAYDPFIAGDASDANYRVPGLEPRLPDAQFDSRKALLKQIDRGLGQRRATDRMDTFYQKAFSLVTAPQARKAFRLDDELASVRERYGLPKPVSGVRGNGMPHLGQCMLLARRLVEAGVRLVSVWAGGQAFDGHREHFSSLTNGLCPPTDRALSALIEDLAERGLLDETLVVALAEFGRTPKLGQVTSTAGANADGRDHWPQAYTIFLAGAGVKPGYVFGATDQHAAYPIENAVSPEDIAATIYTLMGVDPHMRIYDPLNRPHSVADGQPIGDLFA
ncbi:MAG: DUF1501 domain-containing protein [Planctomycetota bacterium]|nr:DUF1501 domain-containing protein [Planctomycetota bacterium]